LKSAEAKLAKGQTEATAPPVDEAERRRLADLRFEDELDVMKSRCQGLELAIIGSDPDPGAVRDGLLQIAGDVTKAMEQLAQDFGAERELRIAKERQ
jgi:hypothetical protein